MNHEFWKNAWKEGRTGFHQGRFNDKLLKYFPNLPFTKGMSVLVPLCGKTRDMVWLLGQGFSVRGIELYEDAVKDFFPENHLPQPAPLQEGAYKNFIQGPLTLSCGDFFQLNAVNEFDYVYDRAALVALPAEMRKAYVEVIYRSLKIGGTCLLITYEYDQSEMEGPPFSISEEEITRLYKDRFTVEKKESERPGGESSRLDVIKSLKQNVYVLKKL